MRAVGYFRESERGESTLAQQNKAFLEFCEREGFDVAGTYADGAETNGHAPGFRQMLAFVRQRDQQVVVVIPDIAALGAELTEAARRLFQLEGIGAQVTSLRGGDGTAAILDAWAQHEESGLSERVRAAMRRKAVKGEVLGRPPYGYKVGSRRRLELVPEEAVVVRYIFRLYLQEGMGIRLIARRLNEEGLKTRRGGNWSMVSIRDILRNRVYLGTYARFGVRVPGSHPQLVASDDFNTVQDRLNSRRTSYAPRVTSRFLLSGIALCGYCGNKLIGVSRKQAWKRRTGERVENSYRYYQCEGRTNQSVCGYHTRRAVELEQEVERQITAIAADGEPLSTSAAHNGAGADTASRDRERARLLARLRAIDRRIAKNVDAASRGRMGKDVMRKLTVSAATDRLVIEDALEMLDQPAPGASSQADALAELAKRWPSLRFGERQAMLRRSVERITVTDDAITLALRP